MFMAGHEKERGVDKVLEKVYVAVIKVVVSEKIVQDFHENIKKYYNQLTFL